MPECMSGTLVSCNMFVAAMLDDLCLDPWPGLSDEELTTYLLKEQWGGLARHRRCIFWIFLLIMGAVLIHWRRAHGCQKDRFFVSEKEIINFWSMAPWSEKRWHLSMSSFPPPVLLRCRQHRWRAASWDAFAQRGSCGKLRGGSIQPLGEKKEWKKRRWQQKWFILIDFSCKNFCQVIWITGNHPLRIWTGFFEGSNG